MATTTGGERLRESLRKARKATGIDGVDVGFFKSAKYPSGVPVASVASWNEFGSNRVPERSFIRRAMRIVEPDIKEVMERHMRGQSGLPDQAVADEIGQLVSDEIKRQIVEVKSPPNAPSTIAKKSSSQPLIDTGFMRQSATWKTF